MCHKARGEVGSAVAMASNQFVCTADAAVKLGVSISWLRARKAAYEFTPGKHWIYATGRPGGRVLWNIETIHQWQAEQTRLSVEQRHRSASVIETYSEVANG